MVGNICVHIMFINPWTAATRAPQIAWTFMLVAQTTAFSGIPNAKRGEQNQKRSPTKGNKIRSGCLTPAFPGAQKRAEMLWHPCIFGGPQKRGTKLELAASPLPSRVPKRGRKCYITPAFSGIPNAKRGEQNQKWSPTKGGAKSEVAASPLPSRGPKRGRKCYVTPAFSGVL